MLFQVKVDLSKSYEPLNKIGMGEMSKTPYWVRIEADDPDDACSKTIKKVNNAINKAFSSLDIHSSRVEQCTDEAIVNMRIIKIECR
jgi:hypothetical protein